MQRSIPTTNTAKLLIVDDTIENLKLLESVLTPIGYHIIFADSGEQALQVVTEEMPDLILLDLMMPGIDGFDTCVELKKIPGVADVPVIFVTAKTEMDDLSRAFAVGAVDYITKPIRVIDVKVRIKTHLEHRFLAKQREADVVELRHLNAIKDHFFTIITHNLQGALSEISDTASLLSDLITDDIDPQEARHLVSGMGDSAGDMLHLLSNLSQWAHIQTGKIQFRPAQVTLGLLIEQALLKATVEANGKQLLIVNQIEPQQIVYADINMIDTVLRNLLSNAIKFTDHGGTITLSSQIMADDVNISIEDTGIGIDHAHMAQLLDVTCRKQQEIDSDYLGSGMGLFLSQALLQKHHSVLQIHSQLGKGSQFSFKLPLTLVWQD